VGHDASCPTLIFCLLFGLQLYYNYEEVREGFLEIFSNPLIKISFSSLFPTVIRKKYLEVEKSGSETI